jgi:hypothetical protein
VWGITSVVEVPAPCRRPLFQFVRMRQPRIGEHSFRHCRCEHSAMSPQPLLLAVVSANALASALFATVENDWSAAPLHSFDQRWRRSIAIRQHTAARTRRRKITGQKVVFYVGFVQCGALITGCHRSHEVALWRTFDGGAREWRAPDRDMQDKSRTLRPVERKRSAAISARARRPRPDLSAPLRRPGPAISAMGLVMPLSRERITLARHRS